MCSRGPATRCCCLPSGQYRLQGTGCMRVSSRWPRKCVVVMDSFSLDKMLKIAGDRGTPCRTPLKEISHMAVHSPCTGLRKFDRNSLRCPYRKCPTISNAFWKSIKLWNSLQSRRCLSIRMRLLNIYSAAPLPALKLASSSTNSSSAMELRRFGILSIITLLG